MLSRRGVDGILNLDLPPDEAQINSELHPAEAMRQIRLIAPTTESERIGLIAGMAEGFIYYVSREGVTGARSEDRKQHSRSTSISSEPRPVFRWLSVSGSLPRTRRRPSGASLMGWWWEAPSSKPLLNMPESENLQERLSTMVPTPCRGDSQRAALAAATQTSASQQSSISLAIWLLPDTLTAPPRKKR